MADIIIFLSWKRPQKASPQLLALATRRLEPQVEAACQAFGADPSEENFADLMRLTEGRHERYR